MGAHAVERLDTATIGRLPGEQLPSLRRTVDLRIRVGTAQAREAHEIGARAGGIRGERSSSADSAAMSPRVLKPNSASAAWRAVVGLLHDGEHRTHGVPDADRAQARQRGTGDPAGHQVRANRRHCPGVGQRDHIRGQLEPVTRAVAVPDAQWIERHDDEATRCHGGGEAEFTLGLQVVVTARKCTTGQAEQRDGPGRLVRWQEHVRRHGKGRLPGQQLTHVNPARDRDYCDQPSLQRSRLGESGRRTDQ